MSSKQLWATKRAHELREGDIIPNHTNKYALEIQRVLRSTDTVTVWCYIDIYKDFTPREYRMDPQQSIPIAVSGIAHMDAITTHEISQ